MGFGCFGYKYTLILRHDYFNEFCHHEKFYVATFHAEEAAKLRIGGILKISHKVSFFTWRKIIWGKKSPGVLRSVICPLWNIFLN